MRRRPDADKRQRVRSVFSLPLVLLLVAVIVVVGSRISGWSASTGISAFATVFLSIIVQATPFLVLGVLLSAAIVAFVPADLAQRALPRNRALAVPVAGAAGMLLPGCECASVPVANGLMRKGVPPAAALTFLLAAPAVNPIVLASTWVAFPNDHRMALARLVASLGAAMVVGWLWVLFGRTAWIRLPAKTEPTEGPRWLTFRHGVVHDFLHAGGYLIVGGLISVVMCICSEADAFVAASFTQFSPTAQLAFMVVGPMVDLKLVAMQAGIFGRDFAVRFAPTTLVCAIIASVIVGSVLL